MRTWHQFHVVDSENCISSAARDPGPLSGSLPLHLPQNFESHLEREKGTHQCCKRGLYHFSETYYLNEPIKEEVVAPTRARGIPLSTWEDLEGQEPSLITLLQLPPVILDSPSSSGRQQEHVS